MRMKHKSQPGGFTLIETLFAAMLIGLVVAAIAVSSSAATMVNGASVDMSTAEFLVEELREMSATMTFDQLDNYTPVNINPPVDMNNNAMSEFSDFTQHVNIVHVSAINLQTVVTSSDFLRITVTINKNNRPVSSASWIRARLN